MKDLQKQKRWRSAKYLKWVKKQSCINCLAPADDPHHIKGTGNLSGTGLTAPDWAIMPLCRGCHDRLPTNEWMRKSQWAWALRTLGRALDEGVLK